MLTQVLEDAGFVNVLAEDRTDQFMAVLQKELNRTQAIKDEFIKVNSVVQSCLIYLLREESSVVYK